MKQFIKETFIFASVMAVVALLSGCMMCPAKQHHGKPQPKPDMISYQYNRGDNMDSVKAKVYTRSRNGGDSEMGYIKFKDTEDGLKMSADLIDMRPNVEYTVAVRTCGECGTGRICCDDASREMNIGTLRVDERRRMETSRILRDTNMRAEQLRNAKIYLKRDGGYRAAWGTMK
ncbi:MAG: hypothetical protein IJ560_00160 [Alphaproteobacteria bacterium]|nr:hypothetical protein [Alphaproteobacteria bacterium]